MKRLLIRVKNYLLLFPASAVLAYLVSYSTWPVDLGLILGVGYPLLVLPAGLTAIVDFALYRISFRPLLVTLAGVQASQAAAHTLAGGFMIGMPDFNFYTAIAS